MTQWERRYAAGMGKVLERIDDAVRSFIAAQQLYFVATAPLAADGHVNMSPKGDSTTFAVLDDHTVAYLDLTGSGIETIAHLRENARITVMFVAFSGPPHILRLHGRGHPVLLGDAGYDELAAHFPEHRGARAVIVVDVERVSTSCGFSVPLYDYVGDRQLLTSWAQKRDEATLAEYRERRNAASIDGLPGWPRVPAQQQ